MRFVWSLVLLLLVASAVTAADRSRQRVREFRRAAPCPVTGLTRGPCPGYVVDHVTPLCAGGSDGPANMAWQAVPDAKAKDRLEARQCRALRAARRAEGG